jgi:phosphate:Na+ symporter
VTILNFLVQLMSGAMLLLFSVRFMRIGIERLWSAQIRSNLNDQSTTLGNLFKGVGLGFLMQGATVVMLMVAGLASTGAIPLVSATLVALGSDLGSAIAVQFLHLPISALGPAAILIGAMFYLRSSQPRSRNFGRVILGLGLIFLSLSMIRTAVEPLGTIDGTTVIVSYFNRDAITAALAGVVLTLLMHSSVAAILTAVAFSSHTALGPAAGLAFMLGGNLGSSLLPVWLLKHDNQRSKVVAVSAATVRSGAAIALIMVIAMTGGEIDLISPFDTASVILGGHLGFNVFLMALAPVCIWLTRDLERRWVAEERAADPFLLIGDGADTSLVLPALKRQLSEMLEITSGMLEEIATRNPDKETVAGLERRLNAALARLRQAYSKLPDIDGHTLDDIQQIVDFAIRVERCGDVFAGKYLDLRLMQVQGEYSFSPEGEAEIAELVDAVRRANILAQETSWTGNVSSAQRLVRHKQDVAELESRSRSNHLARLRRGNLISLGSSDQHLEMIAALKEVNSKFATIGYAVLERHGGLKKSRLKSPSQVSSPGGF